MFTPRFSMLRFYNVGVDALSVCEQVSEVNIRLYSLVHWEDPMEVGLSTPTSPSGSGKSGSTKEGALLYRAGTSYLGKELWKSCYLVLRYSSRCHRDPVITWRKLRQIVNSAIILVKFTIGISSQIGNCENSNQFIYSDCISLHKCSN